MMHRDEVIAWLQALPDTARVGVDDGGLTLRVFEYEGGAYLEVGGIPEIYDILEEGGQRSGTCPHCEEVLVDDGGGWLHEVGPEVDLSCSLFGRRS